jgi:hypothetical protein
MLETRELDVLGKLKRVEALHRHEPGFTDPPQSGQNLRRQVVHPPTSLPAPRVGWIPPFLDGIAICQVCGDYSHATEGGIREKVTILSIDLAKNAFQVHGATADGLIHDGNRHDVNRYNK